MKTTDLAELIMRDFYGGDISSNSGFDPPDFVYQVYNSFAYLATQDYYNNRKDGMTGVDSNFFQTFEDIPVQWDATFHRPYAKFPENDGTRNNPVVLPYNCGIKFIGLSQDWTHGFKFISDDFMYASLPKQLVLYRTDSSKVWFTNLNPAVKVVSMIYVPSKPEYIADSIAMQIRDYVLKAKLIIKNVPLDKLNNANPNDALNSQSNRQERQ